jgi:hypothetical protein
LTTALLVELGGIERLGGRTTDGHPAPPPQLRARVPMRLLNSVRGARVGDVDERLVHSGQLHAVLRDPAVSVERLPGNSRMRRCAGVSCMWVRTSTLLTSGLGFGRVNVARLEARRVRVGA